MTTSHGSGNDIKLCFNMSMLMITIREYKKGVMENNIFLDAVPILFLSS